MSSDLLDKVVDFLGRSAVILVGILLDCTQEAFDCLTMAKGSKLLYVGLVTYSYLPVSIIINLSGWYSLIRWQDSLLASVAITVIYAVRNITRKDIEKSVIFTKQVIKNRRLVKHDR